MTQLPVKQGIDGLPTSSIPSDPQAFVDWFKNSYLPRWAANADIRNAIPGTAVSIGGDPQTKGSIGIMANGVTNEELRKSAGVSVMGNPTSAVANVRDIVAPADGLFLQSVGGQLVWGVGASGVFTADSVVGAGTLGSPLELFNDVLSPGTLYYYGTDRLGNKGFISFADVPGRISDLIGWWESDNILAAANTPVPRLQERTPWIGGVFAYAAAPNATGGAAIDPTLLNGLPLVKWPASTAVGTYSIPPQLSTAVSAAVNTGLSFANGCTIFVVAKGGTNTGAQAILGCPANNGLALYITQTPNPNKMQLVKSGIGLIGACTTTWTTGVPFQANVTYNNVTGVYAWRQARANAGSGTGLTGAGSVLTTDRMSNDQGFSSFLNLASLGAVICYNRILSGGEITAVENYLNAKWGV